MAYNRSGDQFLELWKEATNKYEDEMKVNLATHILAGCNNPDAILAALDRSLGEFEQYRNQKQRLRKWLKPMLHLIGSLSEMAGEAAGVPVPFAKAAFVALGVLVQTAKNVSQRYDWIIDLCQLLHSFLERLRVYMSVQLLDEMRGIVIQMLVHLLSVFALVTKELECTRIGTYLRTLIGRTEVQAALKKLNDLIGKEQTMGTAKAIAFSQEILTHVKGLVLAHEDAVVQVEKDLHNTIQLTIDASECTMQQLADIRISAADSNKHIMEDLSALNRRHLDNSVRNWLNAPDARKNHNLARETHNNTTGRWLIRAFEYKSWKTTSASVLWINGKPGAGKTIICSTAIEDMLAAPGSIVAYFYFYHGEVEKQSLRGMLSSIISQLEEQLPKTLSSVSPLLVLYHKLGDGAHEPNIPELTACLKSLILTLSAHPIFIILDALDECSELDKLEDVLPAMVELGIHVFVTGRPEDAVIQLLQPLIACELDLSSFIYDDISLHLNHVLLNTRPFCSWPPASRDRVLDYLLKHCNGMFQWVTCQLDELRGLYLLRDLENTLKNLPKTLDLTYKRIFDRIVDNNKPHALRLFNWLVFSYKPLRVEELAQVLSIDFHTDAKATYREDWIEPDPRAAILRVCFSLVHIASDGIVQFTHFSVKEFFLSERMPLGFPFRIDAEKAHTMIAASCLAYLLWVGKQHEPWVSKKYPLANYTAGYATVHAQFNRVSGHVQEMLESLFIGEDSRPWNFWVERSDDSMGPRLYWSARLGFLQIVHLLLEHDMDVNAQGGFYGNALQAASEGGHLEIVQLLLEHHADINAQGGKYGNALQAASHRGHLDIVQLLLEHHADINAQGGKYGNALQAAAYVGHLKIVQLLLEQHVDINAQGGHYGNALQAASYGGHLDIVQLLVEHHTDINAQGGIYRNALQAATDVSHLKIVQQLLLELHVDINAQGGHYGNALQAASQRGHLDIVQLLLEHHADINAQGGVYGNALQAAAYAGHLEIAQLLLKHHVDVNMQGGYHANALYAASEGGHLEIVQLLLEDHADINAQGGHHGNALQVASKRNNLKVVRLLLKHHADVNAQGGKYGNALQAASKEGNLKVVQLLLEHCVDINAQSGKYGNALQAASKGGHLKVVQLLLEHHADVNAQGGRYGNAPQAASKRGHLKVVQLLLKHQTDVSKQPLS